MKSLGFAGKTAFLLILALLAGHSAFANITNKGDDAVQIEIRNKNGFSNFHSLFPGQSVAVPADAAEIEISRRAGLRGDENFLIQIVERNGTVAQLDRPGITHRLNLTEEEEKPVELKAARITNEGNVVVDLEITDRNGNTDTKTLYNDQTLLASKNTVKVEVLANRYLRGDERIRVKVVLPPGEVVTITALGGIAEVKEE